MIHETPQARRRKRAVGRLKSPPFLNGLAIFLVAGGMAVAMMVHIQNKYGLYSTSGTMTLLGMVMTLVAVVIVALLDKRWYVLAWAVALIFPPVLFFFALRILEQNPPIAPLG